MTKPIPDNTLLDDLKPSRFLRVEDLTERWKVQSLTVTIVRVVWEETTPNPKDIDPETKKPRVVDQPVLFFKNKKGEEFPRGFLVSAKEHIAELKSATGAKTKGDLIGKRITIVIGEHKKQPVLRISPDAPPEQAPKPSQGKQAEGEKDVIAIYSDLCNRAGIDQETRTAILRECSGDFELAAEKVQKQYAEVLA